MKYSNIFIISTFFLILSCQHTKVEKEVDSSLVSKEKYENPKDNTVTFDKIIDINVRYKDSITTWKGYHKVKQRLESLKTTTPNEVLNISEDFIKEVKLMRDSITVKSLNIKGMKSRINALYNQSLRLQEMKTIPAITVEEVRKQTEGLFVIVRLIDAKINAIYEQKKFENELLEEDFFFSKIDSIQ